MGRRRKKHHGGEGVELNLAAMLDMAFQLLTFFILTFRPAPIEGQVSLRLPPPQAVKTDAPAVQAGATPDDSAALEGVESLVISVVPDAQGKPVVAVGDDVLTGLAALDRKLQTILSDPAMPFEQVIIQVGSELRYEELMRVVETCLRQKRADGRPLDRLSFVEATAE